MARHGKVNRNEKNGKIDATGNVRYATKNRTTSFIFQSVARAAVVSFFARREKSSETYIQSHFQRAEGKQFFSIRRNSHEFLSLFLYIVR